jgi:hypothetical protein
MAELKLAGMPAAYDEIIAEAVKRRHPVQRVIGELLRAQLADNRARCIAYRMGVARFLLVKTLANPHPERSRRPSPRRRSTSRWCAPCEGRLPHHSARCGADRRNGHEQIASRHSHRRQRRANGARASFFNTVDLRSRQIERLPFLGRSASLIRYGNASAPGRRLVLNGRSSAMWRRLFRRQRPLTVCRLLLVLRRCRATPRHRWRALLWNAGQRCRTGAAKCIPERTPAIALRVCRYRQQQRQRYDKPRHDCTPTAARKALRISRAYADRTARARTGAHRNSLHCVRPRRPKFAIGHLGGALLVPPGSVGKIQTKRSANCALMHGRGAFAVAASSIVPPLITNLRPTETASV